LNGLGEFDPEPFAFDWMPFLQREAPLPSADLALPQINRKNTSILLNPAISVFTDCAQAATLESTF
jgi:hypothetical protein